MGDKHPMCLIMITLPPVAKFQEWIDIKNVNSTEIHFEESLRFKPEIQNTI